MSYRIPLFLAALTAAWLAGCATSPLEPPNALLTEAEQPAWSFKPLPNHFIVSVSPAGGTLRVAGSVGTVIGAGVDEAVNDRYRQRIARNLGAYDPAANFRGHLRQRLVDAIGPRLEEVRAMPSSAGYASLREAQEVRLESYGRRGYDALLDLEVSFGLFGPEAVLVVEIEGGAYELSRQRRVWSRTVAATSSPNLIYAESRLSTGGFEINLSDPRLGVEKEAVNRWFEDGGEPLRKGFEEAVSGAASALLCEMGLADEAPGHYYLGRMALAKGDDEAALASFERALTLGGPSPRVVNAKAVALAKLGRTGEALALLRETTGQFAGFGPAWMNLAWLLHTAGRANEEAAEAYLRGRELGLEPVEELDELVTRVEASA